MPEAQNLMIRYRIENMLFIEIFLFEVSMTNTVLNSPKVEQCVHKYGYNAEVCQNIISI